MANCADVRGQTDIQKDRLTDRQTDNQKDIHTYRQTDRLTDRQYPFLSQNWFVWPLPGQFCHCCTFWQINAIQQQNIFFSWMNRPSDDSSRKIIPLRCWELVHTFKHFSEIKTAKIIIIILFFGCCNFPIFFDIIKTFLLDLTLKKWPKTPRENIQAKKKIIDSNV